MEIIRLGSQPSVKGPDDWFTGSVRINRLFQPNGHRRAGAAEGTWSKNSVAHSYSRANVDCLVGTRTSRTRGWAIEEIRPGDIVRFAPGEKHWHGASATMAMTHIATQEELNGKVVNWMEKVSDEQYRIESK